MKREFCWFCTAAEKTRKSPLLVVTTAFSGVLKANCAVVVKWWSKILATQHAAFLLSGFSAPLKSGVHWKLLLHVLVQIFLHGIQIRHIDLVIVLQSVPRMLCHKISVVYPVFFQRGNQRFGGGKRLHLIVRAIVQDGRHGALCDPSVYTLPTVSSQCALYLPWVGSLFNLSKAEPTKAARKAAV